MRRDWRGARAAVCAAAALAWAGMAGAADWSGFKADKPAGVTTVRGPGKKYFSFYSTEKTGEADIETRVAAEYVEFRVKSLREGEMVKVRYAPYREEELPRGEKTFRMVASCEPAQEIKAVIEGNIDEAYAKAKGIKRRHHWKQLIRPVGEERTLLTRKYEFPEGLKHFGVKLELTKPCTVRVYDVEFREPAAEGGKKTEWEPGRNCLVNGGAERGWYGTAAPGERAAKGADGKIALSKNRTYANGMTRMAIDRGEARSGKSSFRFTTPPGAMGENVFYFNPVPYRPGVAACYSAWMKADRNTRVRMNLFLANGIAYNWEVGVSKGWKRYDVAIPEWGAKGKGGPQFFGDVCNGYAKGIRYCMMQFGFRDDGATVWLDDAYYALGTTNRTDGAAAGLATWVEPKRAGAIWRPGETVRVALKVSNLAGKRVRAAVKARALDALGEEVAAEGLGERVAEVEAMGEAAVEYAVKLPGGQRGAMNLTFETEGETAGYYFGVQEKTRGLDPRLGLNVFDGSEAVMREMLEEFGVGTARIWGGFRDWQYDGLKYVDEFSRAGVRMLYVVAGPERETLLPKDTRAWFGEFAERVGPYRGKIWAFEFLNEFNIWSGRRKNPDPKVWDSPSPETYVKHLGAFRELMREVDPGAKIAGPATCNTDLPYIRRVLELGGDGLLDLVTEHSYRQLPECPDYGEDLLALGRMGVGAGKRIAHAQTEAGRQQLPHLRDDLIDGFARDKASWEVRNMITAWAHGAEHYSHFMLGPVRAGVDWNVTMLGNGDNAWEARPGVCMFAYRAASDRLRGARGAGRARLGADYRAYLFDCGKRRVAAVWKWNGNPDKWRAKAAGLKGWKVWDFMGTRLKGEEIVLGKYPYYVETESGVEELREAIEGGEYAEHGEPLAVTVRPAGRHEYRARVVNLRSKFADGAVLIGGERKEFANLAPGDAVEFAGKPGAAIGVKGQRVEVGVELKGEGRRREYGFDLRAVFAERRVGGGRGKAAFWWDDTHLGMRVRARGRKARVVMDPLGDGPGDDDFEYEVTADRGGRCRVVRARASSAAYDSLGKELGEIAEVGAEYVEAGGAGSFRLEFPRRAVSPFKLEAGGVMRVGIGRWEGDLVLAEGDESTASR